MECIFDNLVVQYYKGPLSEVSSYYPDGRVIMGWYYIEGNYFKLCKENEDYESVLFKETK